VSSLCCRHRLEARVHLLELELLYFEWLPWSWHDLVLWFFGVEFAASLAVCLFVLPSLLLPPSLSPSPPLPPSMHLASPMLLLLLLLSQDFCRPSRGENFFHLFSVYRHVGHYSCS
jgi:hypothetical protein